MKGYSFAALMKNALSGHRRWPEVWRSPDLKKSYDVVIVGAGGHGLATAYYLAKNHQITNVCVIEKGWLGGGNTGRNTQVVRSNYYWPESSAFFDRSLTMYEELSDELNFNIMLSQRGILTLAHSDHDLEAMRRWVNAIHVNGVDSELLTPSQIQEIEPLINLEARFPVHGGFIQRRGGIARHDAVAWAYARAASAAGVDIIQECEVSGFNISNGRVQSVQTSKGRVSAEQVCLCVAGHTGHLAAMAGFRLPITSMALQAMVTEPVKPCLRTQLVSATIHAYVGQSDRGEIVIGGSADRYNSYAQRGGLPNLESSIAAVLELFPSFGRLKLMRQWAGTVDITPDTTPIMGGTPIDGMLVSAGWGTGGYKAIPAGGETMAWTIAHGKAHELIRGFGLERFAYGSLIDEGAASGVAH